MQSIDYVVRTIVERETYDYATGERKSRRVYRGPGVLRYSNSDFRNPREALSHSSEMADKIATDWLEDRTYIAPIR